MRDRNDEREALLQAEEAQSPGQEALSVGRERHLEGQSFPFVEMSLRSQGEAPRLRYTVGSMREKPFPAEEAQSPGQEALSVGRERQFRGTELFFRRDEPARSQREPTGSDIRSDRERSSSPAEEARSPDRALSVGRERHLHGIGLLRRDEPPRSQGEKYARAIEPLSDETEWLICVEMTLGLRERKPLCRIEAHLGGMEPHLSRIDAHPLETRDIGAQRITDANRRVDPPRDLLDDCCIHMTGVLVLGRGRKVLFPRRVRWSSPGNCFNVTRGCWPIAPFHPVEVGLRDLQSRSRERSALDMRVPAATVAG